MFTEDLSAFLSTDDFAVAATHAAVAKNVIFEPAFLNQDGIQTQKKTAIGRKSDFLTVAQGDAITINSVAYTVAEFMHDPPDMPDMTLLLLKV